MDLGDILNDALHYPTNNIKALIIYLILGLVVGLIKLLTGTDGLLYGMTNNYTLLIIPLLMGLIIQLVVYFLMFGFSLDIIKFGIDGRDDAPELDLGRQIINGLKYFVVAMIYLIIPIILMVVLSFINSTLGYIIGMILIIIFSFFLSIAECRLADSGNLGYALSVYGVIDDIKQIGTGKVLSTVIVCIILGGLLVFIIAFVIGIILGLIIPVVVPIASAIIGSILDAWYVFYINRTWGLLYSSK